MQKINAACLSRNGCKDKNNTETLVISGISVFFVFPVRLPVVKTTGSKLQMRTITGFGFILNTPSYCIAAHVSVCTQIQ